MTQALASRRSSPSSMAEPVYETVRSLERSTDGHKVAWMAEKMHQPLMDWQRRVADVGKEIDPDSGLPAYREVVVTVMRQNGKTTLLLSVECETLWKPNRRVAYTAQSGVDGRQKFVEDQVPLLEASQLDGKIRQYFRAADNTGMWWWNGSRLKVLNVGQSAGHGKTLDLAVIDEAFADTNDQREQALRPAMVTKPAAQIWNISTAGTPESAYLKRKVDLGRAAVRAGKREGIAYFEWAIPDDEDVYSPDVWARFMPAYGVTITERVLRTEAENMKEGEFRRAYGNQWTETEERVILAEWWRAVQDLSVVVSKSAPVYACDARADRSQSAVVKADRSGSIEVVAVRPGTGWLVDELTSKLDEDTPIAFDRNGPLAFLADDLRGHDMKVVPLDSLDVRKACGRFYDGVADQKMRVRSDGRLDEAVGAAVRRTTADAWAWHRDAPGAEVLMATSLAYGVAFSEEEREPFFAWS